MLFVIELGADLFFKEFIGKMDKFFKLSEHGTTVRTEVLAGLTTFFAMSYIFFVNPQMLSQTGMPAQGAFPCNHYWICRRNS